MQKTIKLIILFSLISLPISHIHASFNTRSIGLTTLGCAIAIASGLKVINVLDKSLEDNTVASTDDSSQKKLLNMFRYGFTFIVSALGTLGGVYIVANANNENFMR
jgi:cytochrome c biogenesis protein CcdA